MNLTSFRQTGGIYWGRKFIFSNPERTTTRSLVPIDLQTGLLKAVLSPCGSLRAPGWSLASALRL